MKLEKINRLYRISYGSDKSKLKVFIGDETVEKRLYSVKVFLLTNGYYLHDFECEFEIDRIPDVAHSSLVRLNLDSRLLFPVSDGDSRYEMCLTDKPCLDEAIAEDPDTYKFYESIELPGIEGIRCDRIIKTNCVFSNQQRSVLRISPATKFAL